MASEQQCKKPHAVMISLPFQGHITPFVNLALKIASKGFAVTFVHLEFVHHVLNKSHRNINGSDFFYGAREMGFDIRYTTISYGLPLEFDRFLNREEYWKSLLADFPGIVDEFVGKIIESGSFLDNFLIADTLYSWPSAIAKKYNLVNVSLWTEPALVFCLDYHLKLLAENGHFPCKDDLEEEITYVPGVDSINTRDLESYLKESVKMTTSPKVVIKAFEDVKKADFILHNTIYELESTTLSALNQYQPNYAIGPLNVFPNLSINSTSTSKSQRQSMWPVLDCSQWLNSKPRGSVLYVSFGSLLQVSEHVIKEVAHGLILSEVNFIWTARDDITKFFPDGFMDNVKDRGMIISWCDQIKVLSNPSVGGFLTHCGWNSVLESIWCAVPMICYPLYFDQPVNRKLVVDDWKIGVNLCDGGSVDRKEVAENVRKVMGSERLRDEMRRMNGILQKASEVDGCSSMSFDQFFEDLKSMLWHRKN